MKNAGNYIVLRKTDIDGIFMNENKEEELFQRRLKELAFTAFHKGICVYTDFLNMNEISMFYYVEKKLPDICSALYGGYPDAERKMLCFYSKQSFQKPDFKISCIHVKPVNQKFSDDLTHRDFLGAVLNLGLERSKLGDILIIEKEAYLFCDARICPFIIDNLNKIKHTNVVCQTIEGPIESIVPHFTEIKGTVASCRLDAVLSVAFHSSRSSLTELITGGKVFINSKLTVSNSYLLKENDIVSVRGYGKFIYKETLTQTKKGRYCVTLLKYT